MQSIVFLAHIIYIKRGTLMTLPRISTLLVAVFMGVFLTWAATEYARFPFPEFFGVVFTISMIAGCFMYGARNDFLRHTNANEMRPPTRSFFVLIMAGFATIVGITSVASAFYFNTDLSEDYLTELFLKVFWPICGAGMGFVFGHWCVAPLNSKF